MSLLWWNSCYKKQLTHNRPSPKHKRLARGKKSIKGISPPAFWYSMTRAGMTVEASLLLPLFLFLFLNLTGAIEMIRLHGNIQLALWDVGKRLSVYQYASDGTGESALWQEIKDMAVSYAYVKREIVHDTGESYLEESPLTDGADSLQLWESEIFTPDGCMEIIVTYQVSPTFPLLGFRSFRMANRYYGHGWNGYDIEDAGQIQREIVYVTENGVVYHVDRSCTHLSLSVREASRFEAEQHYAACAKCVRDMIKERVFVTDEGNCFHNDRACPGLKRTILEIDKKKAGQYKPCSRCSMNQQR